MRLTDPEFRRLGETPGLAPRALAAAALLRAEQDLAFPGLAIDGAARRLGWIDPSDRAAATSLAQTALRWRGPVDARLARRLDGGIGSVDPFTRQVLRVAGAELLGPDAAPAHAAVHAAVEIVKRTRGRGLAGLVNAVLRRLSEERGDGRNVPIEEAATDALPAWLYARLEASRGTDQARALGAWSLELPARTLRLNRRRASPEAVAARFPGAGPSRWSEWCLRLPHGAGDLRSDPLIADGLATQQEEGAFLVAERCPVPPAPRILDACAGRGGKTSALAERVEGNGRIVATDLRESKLRQLEADFARLGLPPPETRRADWSAEEPALDGPFDLVLVDAPCTGTGTLSRRPEIRWRLEQADVARLAALQDTVLERVSPQVAPGGCLVYAVCSLLPDEGTSRVAAFTERHPEFVGEPIWPSPPFRPEGGGAVLLPPETGTDGFFVAALRRAAAR